MLGLPILIVLFVAIIVAYYGVVRGWLFKGMMLFGGGLCMWVVLGTYPSMQAQAFMIGGMAFSWASAMPLVLMILVLITTKE